MDYTPFIKKFALPADFTAPAELTHDGILARAITRADLADDVAGINASIPLIRQTRGGTWPTGPVTEDYNYIDLVWHEAEFRDNGSFTYVLRDPDNGYLGCCYLYPMGRRTPLTEPLLPHDVDVSWWVTPPAYEQGYYRKAYAALQHWVRNDYPFTTPYYSNAELPAS